MDIILLKDVKNLGQAGEVHQVSAGYARNYLVPKGLARMATEGALRQVDLARQAEARRQKRLEAEAGEVAGELDGLTLTFSAKVGETERLYGSITTGDIAAALERETGRSIDRRKIQLEEPIRALGTYTVPVRLLPEVMPSITVVVNKEEELADETRAQQE
jgi:large subunit ribosomal protein L9